MKEWTKTLSSKNDLDNQYFLQGIRTILERDSTTSFQLLKKLQAKIPQSNQYYKARVDCLMLRVNYHYKTYKSLSELADLAKITINDAYETNDELFIAFIHWTCGTIMINTRQLELAVNYRLKTEEIYSQAGYPVYFDSIGNWPVIGELLFHTGDYDQSLAYTKKALDRWKDRSHLADMFRTRYYNTIGQTYEQLGKPDSALIYLDSSLLLAEKTKQIVWTGISSGYKGQVLFNMKQYQKAKPLLELDYSINENQEMDIAAKSLQWLARINIAEGKRDSALLKARTALQLIKQADFKHYLQPSRVLAMCYFTMGEAFRTTGKADSFYYYNQQYLQLQDSIKKVSFESSIRMVNAKIDNENIQRAIQMLQKEKESEVAKRNLMIVAVVLLTAMLLLYLKRVRLKQQHREQIVLNEKIITEKELVSAREQMKQFTENIIEKSDLIDKLNKKLARNVDENKITIEELTSQTILTEADWENFKKMFERVYPRFFVSLKERAPSITIAEQRMAALIKLNLTARQMAAILGISVDSVHKTKQRLRQRLNVQSEIILEETLSVL
jgi:tetratricopeptide (TPR) repeat protein